MSKTTISIDFGDYDLPHLGVLCRRIRLGRGLTAEDIARHCGVSNETISRNIEQWGKGGRKTFDGYVEALSSQRVNGSLVEQPLSDSQAKMLRQLHAGRDQTESLQYRLAALDLEMIKAPWRPDGLSHLVGLLAQCDYPALIIDPLWSIHAANGAALRLFGIGPAASMLYDWSGWHLLGSRLPVGSPVRDAHRYTDRHYPYAVRAFFEDEQVYPYLFTLQMRTLLDQLHQLSNEHRFNFTKWWVQASKFNLPFGPEASTRTVVFEGQEIRVNGLTPRIDQGVMMPSGHTLRFSLVGWKPVDEAARAAFVTLRDDPAGRTVYYATDYDEQRNFHVNSWPAVKMIIDSWLQEGKCT